jgi:hypothetical protein
MLTIVIYISKRISYLDDYNVLLTPLIIDTLGEAMEYG